MAVALLAIAVPAAMAQPTTRHPAVPLIETDRPDFIESSVVVPAGYWQLESGMQLSRAAGRTSVRGTESLLRVSLTRVLEWRLGLPSLEAQSGREADRSDAYLGIKWQVGPVGAWEVAVIPGVSVPVGTGVRASGAWDPEVKLTISRDLTAGFDLCGMFAASWPTDDGARVSTMQPAISVGRHLAPRVRLFVEWVGAFARDRESAHLAHGGIAWQPTTHLQLDAHVGRRLAGNVPDAFVALGLSFRRGP